jgi:hypothetical protein
MPRPTTRHLSLAICLFCLTVLGCHRQSIGDAARESSLNGAVTLRIVNHSWLDVNVYLQQGTHRDRVGTAAATSTTEFHVPLRVLSAGADYRLYGDPIGSRQTVRSEPLHAQDGDVVTWTLEDNLARSFVDVREL